MDNPENSSSVLKVSLRANSFIVKGITRNLNIICKNKTEVFIK